MFSTEFLTRRKTWKIYNVNILRGKIMFCSIRIVDWRIVILKSPLKAIKDLPPCCLLERNTRLFPAVIPVAVDTIRAIRITTCALILAWIWRDFSCCLQDIPLFFYSLMRLYIIYFKTSTGWLFFICLNGYILFWHLFYNVRSVCIFVTHYRSHLVFRSKLLFLARNRYISQFERFKIQ